MRVKRSSWFLGLGVLLALFLTTGALAANQAKKVFDDPNDGKITAASEEAYKLYAEGRALHFKGDYRQSIALMEKAVALDPEFAMAFRSMATAYANLGYQAEWKKYIQQAMDAAAKVSDVERYAIEGDFYDQDEATYDKAIEAYKKLIAIDPTSTWQMGLGLIYASLEQWDKAIERYEVLRKAGKSNQLNYSNLASAYNGKGAFDKAKEVLEECRAKFGPSDWVSSSLADIHVYQGRLDLALEEVGKAAALKPEEYGYVLYKGNILRFQGNLGEAEKLFRQAATMKEPRAQYDADLACAFLCVERGQYSKAAEWIKQAIAWADKAKEAESEAWSQAALGFMLSYMGRHDQALASLGESLKTATDNKLTYFQRYYPYWKGHLLVLKKDLDKAQAAAADFKLETEKSKDKNEISNYYDLTARIELERGNYPQAVEYVDKAIPLYGYSPLTHPASVLETQALAYFRSGNMDKAEDIFKKVQALTSGRYYGGNVYVKSFYMLGQIQEKKGDKVKAAALYKKFLELWKDADSGIAELGEAKEKLKALGVA